MLKLNQMVQYSSNLDRTFFAISDPTRRMILETLAQGPRTISELATQAGMTLTGLKKHVQILEEAELVTTEKKGRERIVRLGPRRLEEAAEWISAYQRTWDDRFNRLEALIERKKGQSHAHQEPHDDHGPR